MSFLSDATIFLAAAVLAVPLFRFLGLGSVLGYLAAGIVIGPWALGLVRDPQSILHFGEIGVVFLLFVVGLELQPSRLWILRRSVFGLGSLQVLTAALVLGGLALLRVERLADAVVIGLALALSSTAFVLQLLGERGEVTSAHGRPAFAILLFQDLAVIPILALLPFLGTDPSASASPAEWWEPLFVLGGLLGFVAGGHYLLRPALRMIVYSRSHEIFIAAALLLVLGAALLMHSLGISMALGAFLAGVLLADSEYRHELEAAIEPFKGLLLGLFFLAVGMTLDVGLLGSRPVEALGLAALLMSTKVVLLFGIARAMGVAGGPARRLALLLSQGGEFAFVIFTKVSPYGLLDPETLRMSMLVVTLSMALTPLLALLEDRVLSPWLDDAAPAPTDEVDVEANPVIIAGFGRSGQVVARLLHARSVPFTALERDPAQLDFVRRFDTKIYFGDAGQSAVMRAAGAERAKLLVVSVSGAEESMRIVKMVRKHFPALQIYATARNRQHALALREHGVAFQIRSTFVSSLELSEAVLQGLGVPRARAQWAVRLFRSHDEETLDRQYALRQDDDALVQSAREAADELRLLIESDEGLIDEVAPSTDLSAGGSREG